MSTLTITADRLTTDMRPADRLTGIDGHTLPRVRVVEAVEPAAILLVNDLGTITEHRLYPDNLGEVTIERDDPEPRKPQRRRFPYVTRDGEAGSLTLSSEGGGEWRTEDGRSGVTHQRAGYTFCEGPHPVRFTPDIAKSIHDAPHLWPSHIVIALRDGKRGYHCEGEAEHEGDWGWVPWSSNSDADSDAHAVYSTLVYAAAALGRALHERDHS